MSQNQSIEEAINQMRDNILRTQSQSNTASITGFDSLVSQLQVFGKQLNDRNMEIARLQELCKKNNIEYAVPPQKQVPVPQAPKKSKK